MKSGRSGDLPGPSLTLNPAPWVKVKRAKSGWAGVPLSRRIPCSEARSGPLRSSCGGMSNRGDWGTGARRLPESTPSSAQMLAPEAGGANPSPFFLVEPPKSLRGRLPGLRKRLVASHQESPCVAGGISARSVEVRLVETLRDSPRWCAEPGCGFESRRRTGRGRSRHADTACSLREQCEARRLSRWPSDSPPVLQNARRHDD